MDKKMRKCPVCHTELQEVKMSRQMVDRCTDCGGVFFDKGELEQIIELVKVFNEISLQEAEIDTAEHERQERELSCPADRSVMDKQEIAGHIIDVCSECGGIWLDDGEVALLRIAEKHINDHIQLYIRLA